MKILVIAAHPDDEVLGCGGTISKLVQENNEVFIAILGEGVTSRYRSRTEADTVQLNRLHTCCKKVSTFLGAKDLFMYNLPDNRFDTVPLLDVIKIVEDLVEKLEPEIIYTHHGGDLNIDHRIVYQAVLTGTRPMRGQTVKQIYTFEIASSTEWSFQKLTPVFQPNVFKNIHSTLEVKLRAMELYESEIRSFPHPRSLGTLRAMAHRWGSVVGCEAAEAFELIRSIE